MAKKPDRSKRHHYVPQCLQKWFCNAEGKIWYAEKGTNDQFVLEDDPRTPKGCFWEKNLNTILTAGGLSDAPEQVTWAKVDQDFSEFLAQAHSVLDTNRTPDISGDSLRELRLLLAMLMTRSPELGPRLSELEKDYLAGLRELSPGNPESLQFTEDCAQPKQAARHIRALAFAAPPPSVISELQRFIPCWGRIEGKHGFVLGSRIILPTGNGGPDGLTRAC